MTKPARDANPRWPGFLLAALVAVLVTLFGAGTASAATASAAQTRVGAHTLVAQILVGPGGGIGAGQRLGNDPPAYDSVLATGVAANTADSLLPGLPETAPKPLGLGSTGRVTPANLTEQLAMEEVRSNPAGVQLRNITMSDSRWPAADGWAKFRTRRGGSTIVTGTRDGVDIRVIIWNGDIVTGYPTNVLRNP